MRRLVLRGRAVRQWRCPITWEEAYIGLHCAVFCNLACRLRGRPARAQLVSTLSAPARVQTEVLNAAGRPVKGIAPDQELPAGIRTLLWTGQSEAGLSVPNGRYLIRLTARSADGTSSQALGTVLIQR